MKSLKNILFTTFFLSMLFNSFGQNYLLNSENKPSKRGINYYVIENNELIKKQFNQKFNFELGYSTIKTDNLELYTGYKPNELGYYFGEGEIIIDNSEKFLGYSNLDFEDREKYSETNAFVRGALIHEYAHQAIEEISIEESISENEVVISLFNQKKNFFLEFIEEGIAEYCALKSGEVISTFRYETPESQEELGDTANIYKFKYKYASYFVEPVLKKYGFREGVKELLKNPPTLEEVLNKELYYEKFGITKKSLFRR